MYISLSSVLIDFHIIPSLKITEGRSCKTRQILRGCEGWCKKIFTEIMEKSPLDGSDDGSAVQHSAVK
jgi:hypothetical protein